MNFITSPLAAPSTGGAAIFIFKAPFSTPTISDLEDRGITRRLKTIVFSVSVYSINRSAPDEDVQYDGLQQSDQDKHEHRGDIEHADRRDQLLHRQHDRVGHAHYEAENRLSREDEPLRKKADKDEQHQHAQQSVKHEPDKHLWVSGGYSCRQPVYNEERIADDLAREISEHEPDEQRDERREACIYSKVRKESGRRVNPLLSEFFDLEPETADRPEGIRVGKIEDQPQDQKGEENKKRPPQDHPHDRVNGRGQRRILHRYILSPAGAVFSFAEYGRSDPNDRCALFDRDLEIVAHAH